MRFKSALLAAAVFLITSLSGHAFAQMEPGGKCAWEEAGQESEARAFRFVCPVDEEEVGGQKHVEIRCGLFTEEGKMTLYAAWKYEIPANRRQDFYVVYTVELSESVPPSYGGYQVNGSPRKQRKDEIPKEEAVDGIFFYNHFGLCLGDISLTDFDEVREAVRLFLKEDEKYRHR